MVDKYPVSARQDSAPASYSIEEIRAAFQGSVIAPDDSGYETARQAFYGGIDNHPAVIIRPRNRDEVARAVRFLLDDDAGYITGAVLAVNGGMEM